MKKNVYMVVDTETVGLQGGVYDVGLVVCDRKGNIEFEYNALVEEIITNPYEMQQAFYHSKVFTKYIPALSNGRVNVLPWLRIEQDIHEIIRDYHVNVVCAYNLAFDARVLRGMVETFGTCKPMLPTTVKTLDLWHLACMTRLNTIAYKELALAHGWVSDAGNYLTNAECTYRFLSDDPDFFEEHTALSDARIEALILSECLKSKVKLPYDKLEANPWKIVNGNSAQGSFRL